MSLPRTPLTLYVCLLAILAAVPEAVAQSIPVARADVDRNCTVTVADANIVKAQLGKRTGQAGFNPNADVDQNGVVNNIDVTFVTRNVGKSVCAPPPAAPTVVATVAPPANANGWHNAAVTVSFACTNAVTCPAAVTVAGEGVAQVVARTVANSAGVTATASVTLNIDVTAPVLVATAPATVVPGAVVAIPVTATDLSGLAKSSLLLRRAVVASRTSAPFDLAYAIAPATVLGTQDVFEIVGEDRAGNAAAVRRPFIVDLPDTTRPTVSLGAPASAGPGATVPLTVRAADERALGRVVVSRNDNGVSTVIDDRTAGPFAFQVLGQIPAGAGAGTTATFVAVATDASGNTTAASANVQVVTTVNTDTLQVTVDPPVTPTFQTDGVITGRIGRATVSAPPPATPLVAALSPASGGLGQTVDVTVTGVNTTFGPLTQVNFGSGVTVQSLSAASATTLTVRVAIAATASIGPRLVAVSTGTQEAILPNGFAVGAGAATVNGRVLNPLAQAIANAQICQPGTTACATSATDGTFSAGGVPTTLTRLVVSASGFDALSVSVAPAPNATSSVGDITLTPTNQPPPPPLPNSPPITPALAIVLGKGATELGPDGDPDKLRAVVRDAFLAAGGREIGVLDANGQQLNPKMVGAGYASVTDAAVEDIAKEMVFGQTMSLAKLLSIYIGSLDLPGVKTPTLGRLLTALQQRVDAVWADPSLPEAPLVMLLFNQGRVASSTAPKLTFDTELNPLQVNLATVSFLTAVTRFLPEGTAPPFTRAEPVALPAARPGLWVRARDALASLMPSLGRPSPAGSMTSASRPASVSGSAATFGRLRGRFGAPQRQTTGSSTPSDRPASIFWGGVLQNVVDTVQPTGWNTAKKAGSLCDQFLVQTITVAGSQQYQGGSVEAALAAQDPNASFLPQPQCGTAVELLELLATAGSKSYGAAIQNMTPFFYGAQATRNSQKIVSQAFLTQSYQDAWKVAKEEAKQAALVNGVLGIGKSLVEGGLSKIQGAVLDKLLEFEAQLVIASVRPRQPFIRKVEQLFDPTTTPPQPSRLVKIWFDRSPNDKGVYDDPAITWRYRLYRGIRGNFSPVLAKAFKQNDEVSFVDVVPADGTYSWVVIGVRQIGVAIDDPPPPNAFLEFIGGFFPTTLEIGAEGAKRAVIGLDVVKTVTQPIAQILRGVRYQTSDPSDPQLLYVGTAPPVAKPPASLAVWSATGLSFISVPTLNSIFSVVNDKISLYGVPNFKTPGSAGLGISGDGTLFTDNSASDAQFGGRVFSFAPLTGARDFAGSVNYFSQLLMFANPVAVQAMVVAAGPFSSNLNIHEESLFIADALNQRVTRMTLPRSLPAGATTVRNVSQPWVSSPLFNFGPDTAMAMNSNFTMAITEGNNLLFASPSGPFAPPSGVQQLFTAGVPSPYQRLSGVTFDGYSNLYVSDSVQGSLSMIPAVNAAPNNGLFGLSAIDKKKLVIDRGFRRPSDVKLSSARDGLVFYDGERIFASVRFGMSGQVVSDTGAPLAGAVVHVPAQRRVAVTDSDGVYILPNLVQLGASPVIDFTVKYQGQTRSYTRVLDIFKHNITDVAFASTPPPIPPDPTVSPILPPPPPPRKNNKPTAEQPPVTISVEFELNPSAPPSPPPPSGPTTCPRAAILTPGFGAALANAAVTINGLVSNRWSFGPANVPDAFLIVNGTATPIALSGLEFSTTATLSPGDNIVSVALPARVLKPIGCAPATAADTDPISVSGDHRVFHDPQQAQVDAYRRAAGWDIAARGIVRTGGLPLAGLDFYVEGTNLDVVTDGDGVFQINIPKGAMAGATAAADQLAASVFADVGRAVVHLRADQTAQALAALNSLIVTAVGAGNAPPAAATSAQTIVSNLTRIQGLAAKLVQVLQAGQTPSPADIAALESIGLQMASTTSNGEIVIQSRDYHGLTLTVKVQ